MKKYIRLTSLVFSLALFSTTALTANDGSYSLTSTSNANSIQVNLKIHKYDIGLKQIDNEKYTEISLPGATHLDEKGKPALPKINKDFLLPLATLATDVKVIGSKTKRIAVNSILPSRGSIMRNQVEQDIPYVKSDLYASEEVFPKANVELSKLSEMRDFKVLNVELRPFQYDFRTNELIITEEIELEIRFSGAQENLAWLQPGQELDLSFLKLYQTAFNNFPTEAVENDAETHPVQIHAGRMLILTHDSFKDQLAEFIQWKKRRGFDVFTADFASDTIDYQGIKDLIKLFYSSSKVSHVLLIGDAEHIPFHPGKSGNANRNEADPMYSLLSGDDYYPEVFVSRIPVKTKEELKKILRKTIDYEKNPELNSDWYSEAMGIASEEGSWSGFKDYERLDILHEILLGWHYKWVDKVYEPHDEASMVAKAVNEGRGFINYIGHGWEQGWSTSGFQNSDIQKLHNYGRWPFIVSVACVNGRFAYRYGESFAEAWLKGGSGSSPTGAIAIFASSTNQSWVPPTVGQNKITELLSKELETSIGGLFFNGSVAVVEDGSSTAHQTFETWHIFGDSSLQVRTKTPEYFAPSVTRLTNTARNSWLLHLQTDAPYSSISLMHAGKILANGVTNYRGAAYLTFENSELRVGDSTELWLTGFNKVPLQIELSARAR